MAVVDFFLGVSASPWQDDQADKDIRLFVRQLTEKLPVGCVLSDNANQTLHNQRPHVRGQALSESEKDSFIPAWQFVNESFPIEIGIKMGLGQPKEPTMLFERKANFVQPQRKRLTSAYDLLYGPLR